MQEKIDVIVLRILIFIIITSVANVFAQDVQWKKHLGELSIYRSVTAVTDGVITVGNIGSIGLNGGTATIVKYNNNGDIAWKNNLGNISDNVYNAVTTVPDGIIVVGYGERFGIGDWDGIVGKGGQDAIIVKYSNNGEIVWKKNFGGGGQDFFQSVTTVSDGVIAVGSSNGNHDGSFGNGDWEGVEGNGRVDAIIVKYDNNGDIVWKKNFGGVGCDYYYSITGVADGVVAIGYSTGGSVFGNSFGNGDWVGSTGNGENDAIIVKYDNNGNVVWKKHFGGEGADYYNSATVMSDGIVAVGYSSSNSFGNGNWANVTAKGNNDAIIVKYDNNGNMLWKKHFGGNNDDEYESVITVSDGIVAVGYSAYYSFDNGDWEGITAKGNDDAIIVKYDNNGSLIWKKSFGDLFVDKYTSVIAESDEIIAVGYSYLNSIGSANTGDWKDVSGSGSEAIIVKYKEGTTEISEVYETLDVKIYPNSTNNTFSIECNSYNTIRLYDMFGKEVLSRNAEGKTEVNIGHLPKGIYIIIVFSENKVMANSKIVKQ